MSEIKVLSNGEGNKHSFDEKFWKDCGEFWLNGAIQGSADWHVNRKRRLTASNFGAAIGKSKFSSPMDVAMEIAGLKKKEFDEKSKFVMQHGVKTEPIARDWYCNSRGVRVEEVGLAVPKWEPRIGASLDGDVIGTDGVIEIKSPLQMYAPLDSHTKKIESGWIQPVFYHDHIWETHYCQMQGGMKITGKNWCDYIVYSTESNRAYVERIPFNQEYWDTTLCPGIKNFLDNILSPLIK